MSLQNLYTSLAFVFCFAACQVATAQSYEDASNAYESGDFVTAFGLASDLAATGDADAQTNLAVMYAEGEGIDENLIDALAWTYIAADAQSQIAVENTSLFEDRASSSQIQDAKRRANQLRDNINQ